jgi:transposase
MLEETSGIAGTDGCDRSASRATGRTAAARCAATCADGGSGVIPRKSNEPRNGRFDRQAYRERNVVERMINRLKQHRRVATRYEKRAANYQAMLTLACILLWL